jgi:HD-GYP domain-containing protein (c-di-GMP phosphodiesterase class II)
MMINTGQQLDEIIKLGIELTEVKDLNILMERILSKARLFVNAEAGSIYIKKGEHLEFSYTQNEVLQKKLPKGKKLIYQTHLLPIDDSTIAGYVANNGHILNIADAYHLPNQAPYKFGKEFDILSGYTTKSMLTVPLKKSNGVIIGILQIINAMDNEGQIIPFSDDCIAFIRYFASNAAILLEKAQMTRTIILRMISMAEQRDPKETGPHVNRVASYAVELYEAWAQQHHLAADEIEKNLDTLRVAAMLHDVGKVGISDLILKKPARFTPDEYEIMNQHTLIGARLFANPGSDFDEAALQVALNHHERWDGLGYPGYVDVLTGQPLRGRADFQGRAQGKKGTEIPIFGRIVAIADVYDALSSRRSYKEPWNEADVINDLSSQAGKQFDPELIEIFLSLHEVIQSIKQRYPDED